MERERTASRSEPSQGGGSSHTTPRPRTALANKGICKVATIMHNIVIRAVYWGLNGRWIVQSGAARPKEKGSEIGFIRKFGARSYWCFDMTFRPQHCYPGIVEGRPKASRRHTSILRPFCSRMRVGEHTTRETNHP